jgi:predicted PurR-regulated permease PerM
VEQLRGVASNAMGVLMQMGLTVVVMLEVFVHGPQLKAYLWDLSPLPDDQEEKLAQRFTEISRAVFLGNGVSGFAQGVLGGLAFYLFDVGSPVLWGAAMALCAPLPIAGSGIIFLPAGAYLALRGEPAVAVAFTAFNAVHVGIFEYGIKPRLIGGQSHMNGGLVFLGVLAGIDTFGIAGLFYGPLILTMFLTLAEIYRSDYRADLIARRSPWAQADAGATAAAQRPTPPEKVV